MQQKFCIFEKAVKCYDHASRRFFNGFRDLLKNNTKMLPFRTKSDETIRRYLMLYFIAFFIVKILQETVMDTAFTPDFELLS